MSNSQATTISPLIRTILRSIVLLIIVTQRRIAVSAVLIVDLDGTNSNTFSLQASSWTFNRAATHYTNCNNVWLLKGYDALNPSGFFERNFYSLPTHQSLSVTISFWLIDTWTTSSGVGVYLGDSSRNIFDYNVIQADSSAWSGSVCGGTASDIGPVKIHISVGHNGATLKLGFYQPQSSTTQFGVRDIQILTSSNSVTSSSYCGDTIPIGLLAEYNCFPCTSNQYLYSNGSCLSLCALPFQKRTETGTGNKLCYYPCSSSQYSYSNGSCLSSCALPFQKRTETVTGIKYCYYPCSGNLYLYSNGSCLSLCNLPLQNRTETVTGNKFCYYPCSSSQYSYSNGSCLSSCALPFQNRTETVTGIKYCYYPCSGNLYLYSNGSCLSLCNLPLQNRTETVTGNKYCYYPCNNSQYLYSNGSCLGSCTLPFQNTTENVTGNKFCYYTCSSSQYLYSNGSCLSSCILPLQNRTEAVTGNQYCFYPCSGSLYLYSNGSCLSSCALPFQNRTETVTGNKYCYYPCSSSQYLYSNGSCSSSCALPFQNMTETTTGNKFCYYPCTSIQYLYPNGSCLASCKLYFQSMTENFTANKYCNFPCANNLYLFDNGTCRDFCATPFRNTTDDLTTNKYCSYPCSGDQHLYSNGSCLSLCDLPLTNRIEDITGNKFCDFPCSSQQYLYTNGTCQSSCDVRFTNRTEIGSNYKYCNYPCNSVQYLFPNGSCQDSCRSPFQARIETTTTNKYCNYLCDLSQYLYPDQTCSTSCSFPFKNRTDPITKMTHCDYPCEDNSYLYSNGSCLVDCNLPLKSRTDNNTQIMYCYYPCSNTQYLYSNGSCLDSCNLPFHSRAENTSSNHYCDYPCNSNQYLYSNDSCLSSCNAPYLNNTEDGYNYNLCTCGLTTQANLTNLYDCHCSTGFYIDTYNCLACNQACKTCSGPSIVDCTECAIGYYFDGTTCTQCHSSCQSCSGCLETQCLTCHIGGYRYWNYTCLEACPNPLQSTSIGLNQICNLPCNDSNAYYYLNGTCSPICQFPFTRVLSSPYKRCNFLCPANTYLYDNSSCLSTCNSLFNKFNQSNYLFCSYPCLSGQFLFWDGSCITSCLAPYSISAVSGGPFCGPPCSAKQYINWNGTCANSCSAPYKHRVVKEVMLCDLPCPNGKYLNQNGTCTSVCPTPMVVLNAGNVSFCNKPCQSNTEIYYYPDKGLCKGECLSPYTVAIKEYGATCSLDLSADDVKEMQIIASISNSSQAVSNVGLTLLMVTSPFDPTTITSSLVSKALVYTKFLDISHTPRLEMMYQNSDQPVGIMSLMNFDVPPHIKRAVNYNTSILVFKKYDINPSFIGNLWDTLMILAITLGVLVGVVWMDWLGFEMRKECGLCTIFGSLKLFLQNFLIGRFYDSFTDIALFASLELHSAHFDSLARSISISLALFFLLFGVLILYGHIVIIRRYQTARRQIIANTGNDDNLKHLEKKIRGVRIIYEDFKDDSFAQQSFFFFLTVRNLLLGLIVGLLFRYPILQICFIVLMNICILIYIGVERPFKSRINLIQQIVLELVLLVTNVSMGIIAILDKLKGSSSSKEILANIIIKDSLVGSFVPLIFLLPKVYFMIKDLSRGIKTIWIRIKIQGFNFGSTFSSLCEQMKRTYFPVDNKANVSNPNQPALGIGLTTNTWQGTRSNLRLPPLNESTHEFVNRNARRLTQSRGSRAPKALTSEFNPQTMNQDIEENSLELDWSPAMRRRQLELQNDPHIDETYVQDTSQANLFMNTTQFSHPNESIFKADNDSLEQFRRSQRKVSRTAILGASKFTGMIRSDKNAFSSLSLAIQKRPLETIEEPNLRDEHDEGPNSEANRSHIMRNLSDKVIQGVEQTSRGDIQARWSPAMRKKPIQINRNSELDQQSIIEPSQVDNPMRESNDNIIEETTLASVYENPFLDSSRINNLHFRSKGAGNNLFAVTEEQGEDSTIANNLAHRISAIKRLNNRTLI